MPDKKPNPLERHPDGPSLVIGNGGRGLSISCDSMEQVAWMLATYYVGHDVVGGPPELRGAPYRVDPSDGPEHAACIGCRCPACVLDRQTLANAQPLTDGTQQELAASCLAIMLRGRLSLDNAMPFAEAIMRLASEREAARRERDAAIERIPFRWCPGCESEIRSIDLGGRCSACGETPTDPVTRHVQRIALLRVAVRALMATDQADQPAFNEACAIVERMLNEADGG